MAKDHTKLIQIFPNRRQLGAALWAQVAQVAAAASSMKGKFHVAVSGGSLVEILAPVLSADPLRDRIDGSSWHVFWADERWVPQSDSNSNFAVAWRLLFSRMDIPADQMHPMDCSVNPDESALAYESLMRKVFQSETDPFPRFDLILLGLGEDGHTASLFPGHPALKETRRWVVPVFNAPKPPPVRMTLTLPVINHARRVVFVVSGSGKARVVSEVFHPGNPEPSLPARMINPSDGDLLWFIDREAAADTAIPPSFIHAGAATAEGKKM